MLEVLFIGLVGLTYTCVQTLFFLNCLNSRRREQRRLEKIYRSSLRKLSVNGRGPENGINGNSEKAANGKNSKENGGHAAENGEASVGGKEAAAEDESEGRLVTRLVVRNGKEAAAASQEARELSHCVQVQNAIVQLNEQSVDGEDDFAGARNGTQSHRSKEGSPGLKEKGYLPTVVDSSGSQPPCSFNITVNSNMIEIRDDGGLPDLQRESNFKAAEEQNSMTTQVTMCEDLDFNHEGLATSGSNHGSLARQTRGNGNPESLTSDDLQEVQEKRLDIEDGCSTEDELEDVCRKHSRGDSGRPPANLISTISQILNSPPDSMEPGTESLPLESSEHRAATTGFLATKGSDDVSRQSAFPVGHADVSGKVCEMDKKDKQRGENKGQPSSASHRVSSRPNPPAVRAGDREGGGTWTLPRAGRRQLDSHGSLPRTRARSSVTTGKEGKGSLEGHTPQQIAVGRPTRRDALPGRAKAGLGQSRSTCHSSSAMAGAATTHAHAVRLSTVLRPVKDSDNEAADSHTRTDTDAVVSDYRDDSKGTTERATDGVSANGYELIVTPVHSNDSANSEGSADSLYFPASDSSPNNNCEQGCEGDGAGEDDSTYESIEPQNERRNYDISNETRDSDETNGDRKSPTVPLGKDESQGLNQEDHKTKQTPKTFHYAQEDEESVGSGSQYETISEADTHRDSGYESPVKADVHSGDDTASVSSGDHDHHYEDIDPALMASRAAARESAGRARDAASASSPSRRCSSSSRSSPREGSSKEEHEEEGNGEAARRKQRLQGLDDLIAEFDDDGSGSAATAVRASSGRRQLQSTLSMPPAAPQPSALPKERAPVSRTHSEPPPPPPPPMPSTPSPKASPSASHKTTGTFGRRESPSHSSASSPSQSPPSSKPSSPRAAHDALRAAAHDGEGPSEEGVVKPSEFIRRNSHRSENGSFRGGHRKLDRPTSLPLDVAEHYGRILSAGKDREGPSGTQEDPGLSTQPNKSPVMNGKSLPFIPPRFPSQPSGSGLIKPSEYLRSLGDTVGSGSSNGNGSHASNGYSNSLPHNTSSSASYSSSATLGNGSVRSQHSFVENSPAAPQQVEATMSSSLPSASSSHDTTDNYSNATTSPPVSMPPGPLPAIPEATEEEAPKPISVAPPPPPAPPAPPANTMPLRSNSNASSSNNNSNNSNGNGGNSKTMLPTISVTDLQSVQLRKTDTKVSRANNLPLKMPMSPEPTFTSVKDDVIAELKMGVDISGIKKMKSERAKEEERNGVMEKEELKRQFSAVNFVDQVPDVDNAGNRIPEWKRQMLARKAAERAKKEAEEQRVQEAEEKRQQAIPLWKRQLLMRREDESKRGNLYTPKVEDVKKIRVATSPLDLTRLAKKETEKEYTQSPQYSPRSSSGDSVDSPRSTGESADASNTITLVTPTVVSKIVSPCHVEDEDEPQIPWRTNLRKTNSKLSLLD
ncbi:PHD finger protein rhinoceros-like isoform X2 [Penaeus japonicus]|uniref:PHD finger protein rhinoceros-like isoform X2 n=1 Tax=Penaeus japonicus TaxID=27405 RepID=UPI001C717549|nr:PHD finger protein rhinoceros-like isoform X2 [Penaeus japonicus]